MKRVLSLFLVLSCLCPLLIVFSVGVSAADIPDSEYTIDTIWWYDNIEDNLPFDNQVIATGLYDYINILISIDLTTHIDKNKVFDFELSFDSSDYTLSSVYDFYLGYTDNTYSPAFEASVLNDVITAEGLVGEKEVQNIRFKLRLDNPSWVELKEYSTVFINADTFRYESGMRWREFVNSEYNTLGLVIEDNQILKYKGATEFTVLSYNNQNVSPDAFITANRSYLLVTPPSAVTYINMICFPFDSYGHTIKVEYGMTWREFINSDLNEYDQFYIWNNPFREYVCWQYSEGTCMIFYFDEEEGVIYDYYDVHPDDVIIENESYYFSPEEPNLFIIKQYTFDFNITTIDIQIVGDDGLLGSILYWIKQIPSNIAKAVQSLFVPDADSILEIKDKFILLLSNRFGFAYESIEVTDNIISAFTYKETKSTIEVPKVTVNLAGSDFTFGGWEVRVIPEGFEDIANTCKLIINVVLTGVFVNGARKRLFEVIGDAR